MSYEAIDQAVRVLNEALEADPGAMLALMNFGVTVNQTLADHPTIQVWSKEETDGQGYRLRPLGLINGLFGVDIYQWGYIAMSLNEDGTIDKFSRTPLSLIHRRTACRRPAEETKGCASESGIMVLKQKTGSRKGAPDRCYHVTTPTAFKSPSTTTAWWPMPG